MNHLLITHSQWTNIKSKCLYHRREYLISIKFLTEYFLYYMLIFETNIMKITHNPELNWNTSVFIKKYCYIAFFFKFCHTYQDCDGIFRSGLVSRLVCHWNTKMLCSNVLGYCLGGWVFSSSLRNDWWCDGIWSSYNVLQHLVHDFACMSSGDLGKRGILLNDDHNCDGKPLDAPYEWLPDRQQ